MPKTDRHTWDEARSSFKGDQRRHIAQTALELLMESGGAALTMSALADRAGISRQTLYRYFPDLEQVLEASVAGLPEMDEAFRASILSEGDPRVQLHRATDALIDALSDASAHGGMTAEELLAALPPAAREAVRGHQRRNEQLVSDILACLSADETATYDGVPEVDAALILGLVSAATGTSRERTHILIDRIIT